MIVFSNNNITEVHYSGYTIDKIYACDGELVYESINCSLPDVPFVLNYNAKLYDLLTNTIPMTSGQTNGIDCVLSGDTSGITISSDHISWGSSSSIIAPIKGSADTNIECCMTIVAKTKSSLGDRRKVSFMRTINRSGDLDDGFRNWDLLYTNFYGSNSIHFERDYWTNQMATMYSNGISASTTEPNIMSFEIHYCTTSNAVLKNHTDGQNVVDNNFNIGATTPDGNTATLFNNDWFGDFYWVYLSMGELTDEQIQQVICYNERLTKPTPTSSTAITYTASEKLNVDVFDFTPNATAETFSDGFGTIEFAESVTAIKTTAFDGKTALSHIDLPSSITSIGIGSFQNCSNLTEITIPSSVTSIGISCFNGCSGLTSITCKATTPPALGTAAFYNTNNCPVFVPSASVETYKATSGWSTYASRIQPIST